MAVANFFAFVQKLLLINYIKNIQKNTQYCAIVWTFRCWESYPSPNTIREASVPKNYPLPFSAFVQIYTVSVNPTHCVIHMVPDLNIMMSIWDNMQSQKRRWESLNPQQNCGKLPRMLNNLLAKYTGEQVLIPNIDLTWGFSLNS